MDTIEISLNAKSELSNHHFSETIPVDQNGKFCAGEVLGAFVQILSENLNASDDQIIYLLDYIKEGYEKKRIEEHEENYPSMLRNKPKGN